MREREDLSGENLGGGSKGRCCAGGGRWVVRAWVCFNAQFSMLLVMCIIRCVFVRAGVGAAASARTPPAEGGAGLHGYRDQQA